MVHAQLFQRLILAGGGYVAGGQLGESLWVCTLHAAEGGVGKGKVTRCSKEILNLSLLH